MRIVHVIPDLDKGGAQRYCVDVCQELSHREGIEVMLVTMSAENNQYSFISNHLNHQVCNSKVLPSITKKDTIEVEEYNKLISAFQPNVIHSHLFWAEMLTRYLPIPQVKYVTHCQNNMPEFNNFSLATLFNKGKLTNWFEKRWMMDKYRRCKNNFIVISKDTEAYYRKTLPADLRRIKLLYHAINFNKFHDAYIPKVHPLDKIRLVYTARFAVYKNHTFLVDIVESLKNMGLPVELNFLGDGECMQEVKQKAEAKGLLDLIKFSGVVDDVEANLAAANIYVHPAYYEPFGLVIIEAMAAGLPVVCLDGKGNRDLIEQGKNGFMFFEQNADIFARQIAELFHSGELYNRIAQNGIEYARSLDIKLHVDHLINYYQSI